MKLTTLLIFCLVDFATAVYERHHTAEGFTYRTSYMGHLAGALSGLLLGIVVLNNIRVHDWEEKVRRLAGIVFVILAVSAITFNIFYRDYFPLPDIRDIIWSQNPFTLDRE